MARQIDPARWCVAVGSPPPGRAAAAKGTGVHWLKGDASWVEVSLHYSTILLWLLDESNNRVGRINLTSQNQNVVRQFGHYLLQVLVV